MLLNLKEIDHQFQWMMSTGDSVLVPFDCQLHLSKSWFAVWTAPHLTWAASAFSKVKWKWFSAEPDAKTVVDLNRRVSELGFLTFFAQVLGDFNHLPPIFFHSSPSSQHGGRVWRESWFSGPHVITWRVRCGMGVEIWRVAYQRIPHELQQLWFHLARRRERREGMVHCWRLLPCGLWMFTATVTWLFQPADRWFKESWNF